MTKDEMMRMAREAGLDSMPPDQNYRTAYMAGTEDEWERFASLVASAEQKECAKVCEATVIRNVLNSYDAGWSGGSETCAQRIRARSEQ